jgi:thioredoxin 1
MEASASNQIVKCRNCGANNRVAVNNSLEKQPVCGRCKTSLSITVSTSPIKITDGNYNEIVANSSKPVLLDLWADWCQPCHMIAPVIEKLAAELAGKVIVGKLNVDENKATAAQFKVQGIPTLLILQNGWEVGRLVGVQSKEAILRSLQPFL